MKKTIVIKVGSHLISSGKEKFISSLASQVKKLKDLDCDVIMVSSGAIVSCIDEYQHKPVNIIEKQACAAIGQPLLMERYVYAFKKYNLKVAQVLLTREDFDDRQRYLNIRNTLTQLLKMDVVPVINENDTIATEEIKLGDNDTLSAIVASKISADMLIILTDVDGLYNKNPNKYPKAKIIPVIKEVSLIDNFLKSGSILETTFYCGTGGMKTKLEAAKIACLSGIETFLVNGMKDNVVLDVYNGISVGTHFIPAKKKISSRKRWIAFGKKIKGKIVVDIGAEEAILQKNKSLLPSGIKSVDGNFSEHDLVGIFSITGQEIARGIVNFSSETIDKIKGMRTDEIKKKFPEIKVDEVIHKDNLVLL